MNKSFSLPWASPLTAGDAASAQSARRELQLLNGVYYLLERRPKQGGRTVLLSVSEGEALPCLPKNTSVRSRVHEYGGGSYLACVDALYFVEESGQQIHALGADGVIKQITHESDARFGDLCEHRAKAALICVRERHLEDLVVNELVSVSLADGEVTVLASGDDFYSSPSLSPDGHELSFISWCHPNMPWHNNKLWRASIAAGNTLTDVQQVQPQNTSSKSQPRWSSQGELYFLDDISNWWNIWCQREPETACQPVCALDADLGRAQWELGASSYALTKNDELYAIATKHGRDQLMYLSAQSTQWQAISSEYSQMAWLTSGDGGCSFIAASALASLGVYRVSPCQTETVLAPVALPLDACYVSEAESFEFETRNGQQAQGFFYAAHNHRVDSGGKLPPLVVVMHGGPTSACTNSFSALVQYWTTRGLAVFDINYRGSTGFGREYRLALQHAWGVADVQDCEDGVKALVAAAKVDPLRVAIRGGSAGGFTALAAAAGSEVFAVVGCHYGVADLSLLARDTHKFESRYLDHLIGPYPETKDRYFDRSPINQLERISCPVFISHGELDRVVPVNQAHMMAEALDKAGQDVELLLFADERHGYVQEHNIATLLERELNFYLRVFAAKA